MFRNVDFGSSISAVKQSNPVPNHTQRIVWAYRGWHDFERSHGGPEIIDFDLSTVQGTMSFTSRVDILSELQRLYDDLVESSTEAEFLRSRIAGSVFYLRALMGEQIPFAEYLKYTLGVVPEPFSGAEIDSARREVNQRLAAFDLEMTPQLRTRFEGALILRDPEEIKDGIVGNQHYWLNQLRAVGIPVPRELHFSVNFVEVDAYWSNWISGSLTGTTLSINVHPRKKYERGRPLALCLHEICGHAVQMAIWRESIAEERLSQACGVTTVHSPETYVSEGLGQTVPDLLGGDENFPLEFRVSRSLQYYTLMILHNAHLMIYQGFPVRTVLDYACDELPFSDAGTIESEMRDRGTNALFRTYQLSYTCAERTIRQLTRTLSTPQKRRFFLEMYTRPMTPSQMLRLGRDLE